MILSSSLFLSLEFLFYDHWLSMLWLLPAWRRNLFQWRHDYQLGHSILIRFNSSCNRISLLRNESLSRVVGAFCFEYLWLLSWFDPPDFHKMVVIILKAFLISKSNTLLTTETIKTFEKKHFDWSFKQNLLSLKHNVWRLTHSKLWMAHRHTPSKITSWE